MVAVDGWMIAAAELAVLRVRVDLGKSWMREDARECSRIRLRRQNATAGRRWRRNSEPLRRRAVARTKVSPINSHGAADAGNASITALCPSGMRLPQTCLQRAFSLLARTALSVVKHGIPEMIGNACPSSAQNQQSGRRAKLPPLNGDTNCGCDSLVAVVFSTTIKAASFNGSAPRP